MTEMKDSGIPWIRKIPSDWETKKVKYLAKRISKGNGITKEEVFPDGDIPCVRYGEIYTRYNISFTKCVSATRSETHSSPQFFSKGDILMAGTGELVEEIGKGVVYLGEEHCMAGGDIIILTPNCNSDFLNFALNSSYAQAQKSQSKSKLKVVHISPSEIGNILIAIPLPSEQQSIARSLVTKCAEIGAIQEKTRESIEEYKKLKQSIITEAVTKGIRKERSMKESGVEWIGEIPEEWRICKMKHAIDILAGFAFPSDDFSEEGVRLLRGINVAPQDIKWKETVYWNRPIDKSLEPYLLQSGDLILGLDRPWIKEGTRVAFIDPEDLPCLLLQRVCRIKALKGNSIRFVYWVLTSKIFEEALTTDTTGISIPHISTGQVEAFVFAMPSLAEQQEIADYLDEKCATIDRLIASKEALITELESYKKSIIYEYVTGKKKV